MHRRFRLIRHARWAAAPLALASLGLLATAATPSHGAPAGTVAHRVVVGDTLWSLAQSSGTSVARLQSLNGLHNDIAVLGTVLYLPSGTASTAAGGTSVAGTGAASTPPMTTTPAAGFATSVWRSRAILSQRAYVSRSTAAALVRSEALRQGVSPSLALAIATQESGFQQGVVSSTDAVGVMQLEPGTATWVGEVLLGENIDRYDVHDNVVAGVALLHELLGETDVRSAIAAYYQGLTSVSRRGPFRDTVAYVNAVLALRTRYS